MGKGISVTSTLEAGLAGGCSRPLFVAWEQVEAIVGEHMQAQGLFPERYRVTQFPTDEQLAKLRAS